MEHRSTKISDNTKRTLNGSIGALLSSRSGTNLDEAQLVDVVREDADEIRVQLECRRTRAMSNAEIREAVRSGKTKRPPPKPERKTKC